MLTTIPVYAGSKKYWLKHLENYQGEDFVELFAGSAVLSFNLAKTAIWNDTDVYIYKILNNFNELIVPETFTKEDYFVYRKYEDWWKYSYNLMKMSFSGVFRYSKNGFNVPVKPIEKISLKEDYEKAKIKYNELNPEIYNLSYIDFPTEKLYNKIVILDPPYEKSHTPYNNVLCYQIYWEYVRLLEGWAKTIILFDNTDNLPFKDYKTRNMRINGKRAGGVEGMFIFEKSLKAGKAGEDLFAELMGGRVAATHSKGADFITVNGNYLELKSDYYSMEKTLNYFIERYGNLEKQTDGGVHKAKNDGAKYFVYFYVKEKTAFFFLTDELLKFINDSKYDEVKIPNRGYTTMGYKVPRKDIQHLVKKELKWK